MTRINQTFPDCEGSDALQMEKLRKAIQETHKFADDAMLDVSKDKKMPKFIKWIRRDILVHRAYLITVNVLLFGFIGLELIRY